MIWVSGWCNKSGSKVPCVAFQALLGRQGSKFKAHGIGTSVFFRQIDDTNTIGVGDLYQITR